MSHGGAILRIAVVIITLILPCIVRAQADVPSASNSPQEKEARLKQLVAILKSISDDDFEKMQSRLPGNAAGAAQAVSRAAVLKSAYKTLAAFEYYKAAKLEDADAVAVNPETMQETGRALDMLKWLGNASLNYWLNGGQTYVGREVKNSKTDKLDRSLYGMEKEMIGAGAKGVKSSEIHYQMSSAYEQLASAAVEPDSDAQRAAKKAARLKDLSELIQTVSDEDYQNGLKQVSNTDSARSAPSSRGELLKSAYVTLAALEYKDAGRLKDLERLTSTEADNMVVNPETLEETGWLLDLFTIGALGGIVYGIFDYQSHHRNNRSHAGGGSLPACAVVAALAIDAPLGNQPAVPFMPTPSPETNPAPRRPSGGTQPTDSLDCRYYGACNLPVVTPPPAVTPPPPSHDLVPQPTPGYEDMNCTRFGICKNQPVVKKPCILAGRAIGPGSGSACPPGSRCFLKEGKHVELYQSLDGLEAQLAEETTAEKNAEIHHKLGAIYEQLAAAAAGPATVKPAPMKKSEPKASPDAEEPEPSFEELQKRDSQQLEDWQKQQREDYRKMRR